MSKIELSPKLGVDYTGRMIGYPTFRSMNPTNALYSECPLLNNNPNIGGWTGEILIMKGEVPLDFSTLVDTDSRNSDLLILYTCAYSEDTLNYPTNFSKSITNINPCTIQTDYVKSVAGGIATWFWWRVRAKGLAGQKDIPHQIIGTVGMVDTGEDLEIPDTNIIIDLTYRITNFKLKFPTSWVY